MLRSTLDKHHALRNIQGFAAAAHVRAVEHRERYAKTGEHIHKVLANYAAGNAAAFAAVVRRELGNV
jgi:hypothetical protein